MRKMSLKRLWLVKSARRDAGGAWGCPPWHWCVGDNGIPWHLLSRAFHPFRKTNWTCCAEAGVKTCPDFPRLELGHSHALKRIRKPRRSITVQTDSLKGCVFRTCEFINIYTFAWSLLAAACLRWLGRGWGSSERGLRARKSLPLLSHPRLVSPRAGSAFYGQSRCPRQVDTLKGDAHGCAEPLAGRWLIY